MCWSWESADGPPAVWHKDNRLQQAFSALSHTNTFCSHLHVSDSNITFKSVFILRLNELTCCSITISAQKSNFSAWQKKKKIKCDCSVHQHVQFCPWKCIYTQAESEVRDLESSLGLKHRLYRLAFLSNPGIGFLSQTQSGTSLSGWGKF